MKTIKRFLEELAAKYRRNQERRKSAQQAAAVACRMALNGCRM